MLAAQVSTFLHATPGHLVLGLQIFQTLVTEMNSSSNTRSLTQHRKIAGAFRDTCLHKIFTIALETLQQLQIHAIPAAEQVRRVDMRGSHVPLLLSGHATLA